MMTVHTMFILISEEDTPVPVHEDDDEPKYDGSKGLAGLSTMYKIGSKPDLRIKPESQGEFKVVNDYSGVAIDDMKPNLIFGKSESVIDDDGKRYLYIQEGLGGSRSI